MIFSLSFLGPCAPCRPGSCENWPDPLLGWMLYRTTKLVFSNYVHFVLWYILFFWHVYFRRMLSPIGRNSLFCCRRFGIRLSDIASINKSFVWAHYQSQLPESLHRAVLVLLELLFAKLGYFSISCLSHADITHAVDFIWTSWCLLYVLCVYFLYFVLCVRYT